MAGYHVYIDESGSFSFHSPFSLVGGFVCREESGLEIRGVFQRVTDRHNHRALAEWNDPAARVTFPDHFHFMPLHDPAMRTGTDKGATIPPDRVPELMGELFREFRPLAACAFRTRGLPRMTANEQSTYLELLRQAVLQLFEKETFPPGADVAVTIAHRRVYELYGEAGYADQSAYEKRILKALELSLQDAFPRSGHNVSFFFGDARTEAGLVLADLVCGAFRFRDRREERPDYLEGWENVRNFPYREGFRLNPSALEDRIAFVRREDPFAAAWLCLDILSGNPGCEPARQALRSIAGGWAGLQGEPFWHGVADRLRFLLREDPDRYGRLDEAAAVIRAVRPLLGKNVEAMTPARRSLLAALLQANVELDSHRGSTSPVSCRELVDFLGRHGATVFGSPAAAFLQRLEAHLQSVQVSAFNRFLFLEAEREISPLLARYRQLRAALGAEAGQPDDFLARLEGTLGQVCGFLADLEPGGGWSDMAEGSLREDAAACVPGSAHHAQGLGYLTVLHWKRGDVPQTEAALRAEAGFALGRGGALPVAVDLYDLEWEAELFAAHPFLLLHRLQLCALARAKTGRPAAGLDAVVRRMTQDPRLRGYPRFLSAKWAGVLLVLEGRPEEALAIASSALPEEGDDAALEAAALPLRMLAFSLCARLGRPTGPPPSRNLARILEREPEVGRVMGRLAQPFPETDPAAWEPYAVAALAPFYFA